MQPADLETPPDAPADDSVCANCGHEVVGNYCAACGQANTPLRQPVHRFLAGAIQEYFGIDGRLWTSLGALLFRPGKLTVAYLEGRRVRYLRPLRLYLSATLVFFFLLSVLDPAEQLRDVISSGIEEAEEAGTMPAADRVAALDSTLAAVPADVARQEQLVDSLRILADSLGERAATDPSALETLDDDLDDAMDELEDLGDVEQRQRRLRWQRDQIAQLPPDSVVDAGAWDEASRVLYAEDDVEVNLPEWMPRSRPIERLAASRTSAEKAAALADFARGALGQLPTVMFLLLPLFALLLKGVYVRRGWYYSEHLVFALHTHAFAFVVFIVIALLLGFGGEAGWIGVVVQVLLLTLPVYFFVAQKRVYGQGWLKTGVKALLLGSIYGFVLVWGLVLAILLAAAV